MFYKVKTKSADALKAPDTIFHQTNFCCICSGESNMDQAVFCDISTAELHTELFTELCWVMSVSVVLRDKLSCTSRAK